ncbi:hypothetical protein HK101_005825, partial [Irineochytrium annulatum]
AGNYGKPITCQEYFVPPDEDVIKKQKPKPKGKENEKDGYSSTYTAGAAKANLRDQFNENGLFVGQCNHEILANSSILDGFGI